MRADMTDWVFHFVHRRNPEYEPEHISNVIRGLKPDHPDYIFPDESPSCWPYHVDPSIDADFEDWHTYDDRYFIEPDAYAIQVLIKILDDGHIRAGWAHRSGRPSIYGPRAACCFTEMPLWALMEYARARRHAGNVGDQGIALLKSEFYAAGGRPVIYGLSSPHREQHNHPWARFLATECGLAEQEQYRYVATNLARAGRPLDWTHEREWRWPVGPGCCCPGLPVWLADSPWRFSIILVIVQTNDYAVRVLDRLKELYDAGSDNWEHNYSREALRQTRVLSLEALASIASQSRGLVRLEDLPLQQIPQFDIPKPQPEMIARVKEMLKRAEGVAAKAAEEWRRQHQDQARCAAPMDFGWVYVMLSDPQSEVVQALLECDALSVLGGVGHRLRELPGSVCTTGGICEATAAAEAVRAAFNAEFPELDVWLRTVDD